MEIPPSVTPKSTGHFREDGDSAWLKRLRKKAKGWASLGVPAWQELKPVSLESGYCGPAEAVPWLQNMLWRTFPQAVRRCPDTFLPDNRVLPQPVKPCRFKARLIQSFAGEVRN
jgi:hypothetical protein